MVRIPTWIRYGAAGVSRLWLRERAGVNPSPTPDCTAPNQVRAGFIPARRVGAYLLATLLIVPIFLTSGAVPAAVAGKRVYTIQLGSYKSHENALEKVNELNRLGHNAFYRHETVRGVGEVYRVYVERFESKEEAVIEAELLKELELISEYTIRALDGKGAKTLKKPAEKLGVDTYHLHVGSYQTKGNAEKEVGRLMDAGYDAFLFEEEVSGKKWFRVYVGEFDDENKARKLGSELRKKGIISYFKTRPSPGK